MGCRPWPTTPSASSSCVEFLRRATVAALGPDAARSTPQSLGGEDFAWYVQEVPGAMARLGTRTPGGQTYDLHQGDLVVDERAVLAGAQLLAAAALDVKYPQVADG
ncbi:MAG: M20/M25/M40 family metallo-hydrolase [Dermatophilaceae bacterium]